MNHVKRKITAGKRSSRKSYIRYTKKETLDSKTIKPEKTLETMSPKPFFR